MRGDELITFIRGYQITHGHAPSYRDIAKALGISISTVKYRLDRAQADGKLRYSSETARSIVLTDQHCVTCTC